MNLLGATVTIILFGFVLRGGAVGSDNATGNFLIINYACTYSNIIHVYIPELALHEYSSYMQALTESDLYTYGGPAGHFQIAL
jgi:hypothetical protein